MSWAARRRVTYSGTIVAVALIITGGLFFFFFYDAPSCFDGEQNGNELGIDCGGACQNLCPHQTIDPLVLWSRVFEVVPGVYNAVAYVDNPNPGAQIESISYTFEIFDDRNILIAERKGRTHITRTGIEPIFEPTIQTGNRKPSRTFFEFTENPVWERRNKEFPELSVLNRELVGVNGSSRITATLRNEGVDDVVNVEVVVTVFDQAGNAIASSRTVIELLEGRSSRDLVFTWPQAFSRTAAKIDIIPRVSPGR